MNNNEIKKSIIKMYEPLKEQDLEYYEELQKIIDYQAELENIIQKAIEYIENNTLYKEEIDYDYEETPIYVGCNDLKAREELLDILRGNDNE